MTKEKDKIKGFWQLFQEWQILSKKNRLEQADLIKMKDLEEQLGGYLIDTPALREELIMACRIMTQDSNLRERFLKKLDHSQVIEEEKPRSMDCEGDEFWDQSLL